LKQIQETAPQREIKLLKMMEGEVRHGYQVGFSRILNNQGHCQIGYWESIAVDASLSLTIPWGKWTWYVSDNMQKVIQDYYLGAQDPKNNNEIKIIKIKPSNTKSESKGLPFYDYFYNVEMSEYTKTLNMKKQHWGKDLLIRIFKRNANDWYLE